MKAGYIQKLTFAERWFRDGLLECGLAGSTVSVEADVSRSAELLQTLRAEGRSVKWTTLFVKAAAVALHRNPELSQLVAGNSRLLPDTIDICLSVSSEQAVTPVIVLQDCARRDLDWVAAEIIRLTPISQESDKKMVLLLNRWGFLGFTAGIRRALIGFLLRRVWYRRKVSGTFQVTCLPGVDSCSPFRFNTSAVLGIGQVKQRPIVVEGALAIRPTVMLTCCIDHAVWNGADTSRFLNAVKSILELADYSSGAELPIR